MRNLLIILCFLSGACQSMQNKAFDNVHVADTEEHLVEVMGRPQFFIPSVREKHSMGYYYQGSGYICGFTIRDGYVTNRYCSKDPDYKATALKAGEKAEIVYTGFSQ